MEVQEIIDYCLLKKDACMDLPFGDIPICFKINKRIFCEVYPQPDNYKITVKCDPQLALLLREKYKVDVIRGYHCPPVMQPYRNTVFINRSVADDEVRKMIDHSYEEVLKKLKNKTSKQRS